MNKLSDKIKIESKNNSLVSMKYVKNNYLPEIENIEKEKEELIQILTNILQYRLFFEDSMDENTTLKEEAILIIEKHKNKSWDQITKEQE